MGGIKMELQEYFEKVWGLGVLYTADVNGRVNSAVYSMPHIMEDGSLAFIMRDRLTGLLPGEALPHGRTPAL